jgi:uncharacterized protein (DUF302 family)
MGVIRAKKTAALWLLFLLGLMGPFSVAQGAGNPAWWKYQVKGDFATVLANLKSGLEASQFVVTGEEDLSKGLENNKSTFGEGKWNTIGFQHVTAIHFCSLVFNHEVFNLSMDWSILCPFKAVAYSMKKTPDTVTIITLRPTYLLMRDPHKDAKKIATKIENRIIGAIKAGVSQ